MILVKNIFMPFLVFIDLQSDLCFIWQGFKINLFSPGGAQVKVT